MTSLNNARFRDLVLGAAASCGGDVNLVRQQLATLEADARRWRGLRNSAVRGDHGFLDRLTSYPMRDPHHPTEEEIDAAADHAISRT